ncbi:hypothetical protein AgCh_024867 [Apium graveolens]
MIDEGFHRESYYVDNFISGLKDEIAQHLYNNKPQMLQEARELARGQEHYLNVLDKHYRAAVSTQKYTSSYPTSYKPQSYPPKSNESSASKATSLPSSDGYGKFTIAEISEKKNKRDLVTNKEGEELAIVWNDEEQLQKCDDPETAAKVLNTMGDPAAQTKALMDFSLPKINDIQSSIVRPTITTNNFEIKPGIIQ